MTAKGTTRRVVAEEKSDALLDPATQILSPTFARNIPNDYRWTQNQEHIYASSCDASSPACSFLLKRNIADVRGWLEMTINNFLPFSRCESAVMLLNIKYFRLSVRKFMKNLALSTKQVDKMIFYLLPEHNCSHVRCLTFGLKLELTASPFSWRFGPRLPLAIGAGVSQFLYWRNEMIILPRSTWNS